MSFARMKQLPRDRSWHRRGCGSKFSAYSLALQQVVLLLSIGAAESEVNADNICCSPILTANVGPPVCCYDTVASCCSGFFTLTAFTSNWTKWLGNALTLFSLRAQRHMFRIVCCRARLHLRSLELDSECGCMSSAVLVGTLCRESNK